MEDGNLAKPKVCVNKLFKEIAAFCPLPSFNRLGPLPPLPVNDNSYSFLEPPPPLNILRGLGTKRSIPLANNAPQRKLPKTRKEVTALFTEIRDFCRFDLPFKLNDLEEVDRIQEVTKAAVSIPTTEIVSSTKPPQPTRCSKRISLKSIQPSPTTIKQEDSSKSFTNLMFNFSTHKNANTIQLPKGIKSIQVKKVIISKKSKTEVKPKPTITTTISKAPPASFNMLGLDLVSCINSCRTQMNSIKTASNETLKKRGATVKSKRRSLARSRKQPVSKDDSIESGYSSSQSSVPSPSSLLSSDSLDMDTSGLRSYSHSVASSECSYHYKVNPNGEGVYLRSQYDYYLDKATTKLTRGTKLKSTRTASSFISPLIVNTQCDTSSHGKHARPEAPAVTQKVLEWQSKTLLANSCPTPQHESCHFEETPPNSPLKSMPHFTDYVNHHFSEEHSQQDQLDFDCLADFNIDNMAAEEDKLDLEWLQELSFDQLMFSSV